MRNERERILPCLRSLTSQTYPADRYEILVADGRSTDGSKELAASFENAGPRVRILDNSSQKTPSGMNLGIRAAMGEIIIIAGAHAIYPDDFVENCIVWLNKTEADVVGGPVTTVAGANHFAARLSALILSSPFGVGNSRFRTSSREGYVDTVPFGAYRREILERVGLFNEKLVRNQDNDLSARIRRAGGKIFLTPRLRTTYFSADSFLDLLRQTFRKSQWHIVTLRENIRAFGCRHLCPAGFVVALILLLAFAPWSAASRILLSITVTLYFASGFWLAFRAGLRESILLKLSLPLACFCFHIAYGLGTLAGTRYLFVNSVQSTSQKKTTHRDRD